MKFVSLLAKCTNLDPKFVKKTVDLHKNEQKRSALIKKVLKNVKNVDSEDASMLAIVLSYKQFDINGLTDEEGEALDAILDYFADEHCPLYDSFIANTTDFSVLLITCPPFDI